MDKTIFFNQDDILMFEENHIKDVDKIIYSKNNLIIGENGSGKTRFLKALEKQKQRSLANNSNVTTVTLYFTEISSNMPEVKECIIDENIDQENSLYIYDILRGNVDVDFKDFLKIVESADDRCIFIKEFIHLKKTNAPRERQKAIHAYNKLNDIFKKLLNRQFSEKEGHITINKYSGNRIIHSYSLENAFMPEMISPGELMLFYFVLFLYYLEVSCNKKLVLIIDEPEQHLHPHKQLYLIRKLMESEFVSELWVASHSLFLVPLFDFEGLILIKNSRILNRNSDTYKNVYNSLVGLENTEVFEFLKSINNWQYYQFIIECFCLPKTKDIANKKDEQFIKILKKLKEKQSKKLLEILDYGAGKCRIWDCLKLEYPDRNELDNFLKYTAFEPYPEEGFDYDSSISVIKNHNELTGSYDNSFDVVILMNVLHEIPIIEWLNLFEEIKRVLSDEGILVFLEVKNLTNGEQPYGNNGYLVLANNQVKLLFDEVVNSSFNNNGKNKSNIWVIDKISLGKVDEKAIKRCIESLRDSTESELRKEFYKKIKFAQNEVYENTHIPARRYGFLSQQYINAKFALEELCSGVKKKIIPDTESSHYNPSKVPPPPINNSI